MSFVYFLTWGISLVASVGIWGGLWWFKRGERQPSGKFAPVSSTQQRELETTVSRYWKSHRGRPDRAPFYVCMMWSLFVGGLIMLIGGPIHPSTIDAMDATLQRGMAAMLCLGTGLCIVGFTRGTRYLGPNADLRDCYQMAVVATPANVSTLAVYAMAVGNTVHWDLRLFGLGAGGILAVMCAHLLMAWDLHQEVKRLDERVGAAIQAVLNRVSDDQVDH